MRLFPGISAKHQRWATPLLKLLGVLVLIIAFPLLFDMSWENFQPFFKGSTMRFMAIGAIATIVVSLVAIMLSLPLATLLALGRLSPIGWIKWPSIALIEVVRSLPLLLLIFYININLPNIIGTTAIDFLEGVRAAGTGFWNALTVTVFSTAGLAVIAALTIYTSAVNAELLRSGILSLDRGQTEAARSLGLTYWQTMRKIVLPQAYRRTLAPLIAQFTILVKDTSLGAIIGFIELLRRAQILFQRDFNPMEALYVAALIYFVINYVLGLSSRIVERRIPSIEFRPVE